MPASGQEISRIALLFLVLFLIASCGSPKTYKPTPGRAQNTPVPGTPPVQIDTSLDQDIRTRHLEEKISRLEDRVALLEKNLSSKATPSWTSLPKQAKPILPPAVQARPTPPSAPVTTENLDPVKLYKKGRTLLLEEHNISTAQALLSDFVKKFPDHELADNALYWLGECSYTKGNYEQAAEIFKTLVQTYPKGQKVPDALLKTGYSYMSMDDVGQADHYFKQVITRHPFSPAADKAQKKLSRTQ